jgi:hypothetical protein
MNKGASLRVIKGIQTRVLGIGNRLFPPKPLETFYFFSEMKTHHLNGINVFFGTLDLSCLLR